MSVMRWTLSNFLEKKGLTRYALVKASGISQPNTVYRIARLGHEPTRIDIPTLKAVLDGLRKLTGEDVQISDILEYIPDS